MKVQPPIRNHGRNIRSIGTFDGVIENLVNVNKAFKCRQILLEDALKGQTSTVTIRNSHLGEVVPSQSVHVW